MTVLSLILLLMVIPAVIGYAFHIEGLANDANTTVFDSFRIHLHHLFHGDIEPGDFLIYRKPKVSPRPGPRARNVRATERGDDYHYEVDKFWTVADVLEDGRLLAVTRTGKRVCLTPEDRNLRKAGWIERFRYRRRFPAP